MLKSAGEKIVIPRRRANSGGNTGARKKAGYKRRPGQRKATYAAPAAPAAISAPRVVPKPRYEEFELLGRVGEMTVANLSRERFHQTSTKTAIDSQTTKKWRAGTRQMDFVVSKALTELKKSNPEKYTRFFAGLREVSHHGTRAQIENYIQRALGENNRFVKNPAGKMARSGEKTRTIEVKSGFIGDKTKLWKPPIKKGKWANTRARNVIVRMKDSLYFINADALRKSIKNYIVPGNNEYAVIPLVGKKAPKAILFSVPLKFIPLKDPASVRLYEETCRRLGLNPNRRITGYQILQRQLEAVGNRALRELSGTERHDYWSTFRLFRALGREELAQIPKVPELIAETERSIKQFTEFEKKLGGSSKMSVSTFKPGIVSCKIEDIEKLEAQAEKANKLHLAGPNVQKIAGIGTLMKINNSMRLIKENQPKINRLDREITELIRAKRGSSEIEPKLERLNALVFSQYVNLRRVNSELSEITKYLKMPRHNSEGGAAKTQPINTAKDKFSGGNKR